MKINPTYINDYKTIVQTTNLQKGYQETMKFFRGLRVYLASSISGYKFTGNVVENNMDYSYFQFSNEQLQAKGLKFVVTFSHNIFEYQIWLSGMNRKIQISYHKALSNVTQPYILSPDPNRFDYILKEAILKEIDYVDCEKIYSEAKDNIITFVKNINQII